MQIRPLRRRWDGHGLAFMFEGEGIPTAHKSCVAKLESSYLASINTKLDNCSSGKKKKSEHYTFQRKQNLLAYGAFC